MGQHPLLQYFKYEHLPERLQVISKPFHTMAHALLVTLGPTADQDELTMGLRKLLESKDCMVRAALSKKD